jgi:hypothetical protein
MENSVTLTIDKYQINGTKFTSNDVLESGFEREERSRKLKQAMILGNIYKHRVRLFFKNRSDQVLKTEAKVRSVTEKYVVLKNSIHIPIASVLNVEYI